MLTPKISWYVLEDIDGIFEYSPKRTYDLEGSYTPGDTAKIKLQLWNNRLSIEDAADAKNPKLVLFFKNYEDNYLLKLCKVKVNNKDPEELTIDMDRGIYDLKETLSGKANNGSDLNVSNFIEFELQVGPLPNNLKSELKGMVLDVEYEN